MVFAIIVNCLYSAGWICARYKSVLLLLLLLLIDSDYYLMLLLLSPIYKSGLTCMCLSKSLSVKALCFIISLHIGNTAKFQCINAIKLSFTLNILLTVLNVNNL